MALKLHNIKRKSLVKKKKRVGRGNGSGKGTYSTRGLKGQRSRSGGKAGLKKLGLRARMMSTPKNRGMKSLQVKPMPINVSLLSKLFKNDEIVTLKSLKDKNVIKDFKRKVKILGNGQLNKNIIIKDNFLISQSAKEKIEKAGGKIEVV